MCTSCVSRVSRANLSSHTAKVSFEVESAKPLNRLCKAIESIVTVKRVARSWVSTPSHASLDRVS